MAYGGSMVDLVKKFFFIFAYFFLIFSISPSTLADEKAWYENTEINGDVRLSYEGIYNNPGHVSDRE